MGLDRDMVAVTLAQANLSDGREVGDGKVWAAYIVALTDDLRAALALTPPTVAPVAATFHVGDVLGYPGLPIEYIVTQTNPLGGKYKSPDGGWSDWYGLKALDNKFTYLRPSTDAEKRAAGLAVPPPAPTPAPEAKRPEWVRFPLLHPELDIPNPYIARRVVRWNGGRPVVSRDDGTEFEHGATDWEPAPCPPPVAGRVATGHGLPMRDLVASTIYASLGGSGSLDGLITESRRAYLAAADAVLALLPGSAS